ncbi:MAG: hypothetical protein SR1Q7_04800 [Quinella sp. 1Q7]|nr:hypothetical protein [Quinella sp. 1Q7]
MSWLESRRNSTTRKKKFPQPAQVAENFSAARRRTKNFRPQAATRRRAKNFICKPPLDVSQKIFVSKPPLEVTQKISVSKPPFDMSQKNFVSAGCRKFFVRKN